MSFVAFCLMMSLGLPAAAGAQSPTVSGYVPPGSLIEAALDEVEPDAAGTSPSVNAGTNAGTLPFTGLELGLIAALGVALALLGFTLRRASNRLT